MPQGDSVADLMSKTVRAVRSDETLGSALRLMVKFDVGSIVVKKNQTAFGILTERDLVKRIGKEGDSCLQRKAAQVASTPLVTVGPEVQVWEAFTVMLKRGIRRLPVVSQGKLVGIITERDLLKWVVRVTYEPNIPEEIRKLIVQNP